MFRIVISSRTKRVFWISAAAMAFSNSDALHGAVRAGKKTRFIVMSGAPILHIRAFILSSSSSFALFNGLAAIFSRKVPKSDDTF
jgi:hypothetical protein